MSQPPFSIPSGNPTHPLYGRRRGPECEPLLLTELNPHAVIDNPPERNAPVELQSFGTVREPCPKCQKSCLHLILRQANVRTAHLLCLDCGSCYDAHYAGGAPALTI
jgi:hypothetical protein